ncbi:hypothetical protein POTOM_058569 [Populus tomentosa]|uniref:Uncharacterized protein n=1 Tax=Populus tomentosa TaxID=118781 RepID=A0A8X7XX78_POPTO|nr:hypothetical protein POTOM_058569 [Populus tomentosa]
MLEDGSIVAVKRSEKVGGKRLEEFINELMSGRKPVFSTSPTRTRSLAKHFITLMEERRLFDILDARMKEYCQNEEVVIVASIAKKCLNLHGRNRPIMREVTSDLERIIKLSQAPHVQQDIQKTENIMANQASSSRDAFSTSMAVAELERFIITH